MEWLYNRAESDVATTSHSQLHHNDNYGGKYVLECIFLSHEPIW